MALAAQICDEAIDLAELARYRSLAGIWADWVSALDAKYLKP